MVLETYRNQPIKTIFSVLLIILGVVTILNYQELEFTTFESVVNLIFHEGINEVVYKTLAFNLISTLGLLFVAILWIKSAIKPEWYYDYTLINRWINIITAVILVLFSLIFIVYLFQKLTGFIIVSVIILLFVLGNDDYKKQRR